jgi:hypothetical protein
MTLKARPKPCYLDAFDVWKVVNGNKVWRSADGRRLYTWDGLHGEIEAFDRRGDHLGALDAGTGKLIKLPDKGKKLDVR